MMHGDTYCMLIPSSKTPRGLITGSLDELYLLCEELDRNSGSNAVVVAWIQSLSGGSLRLFLYVGLLQLHKAFSLSADVL